MDVGRLREILAEYPPDAPVVLVNDDYEALPDYRPAVRVFSRVVVDYVDDIYDVFGYKIDDQLSDGRTPKTPSSDAFEAVIITA